MDKVQEIMALVTRAMDRAMWAGELILDDSGEFNDRFNEAAKLRSNVESKLRELLERKPLSHSRIIELQESHVGGISTTYPLDDSDWLNFARAIEIEHGIKGA